MLTFSTTRKGENVSYQQTIKNPWTKTKSNKSSHWISCSAHSLCRVGALAPAAPTSRSSQSNWRSSWRESLSAVGRRGFLSPPHCPDQTARPWSSSVSLDWPTIHRGHRGVVATFSEKSYSCCKYVKQHITSKIFSVGSRFKRDAVGVSSFSYLSRNRHAYINLNLFKFS